MDPQQVEQFRSALKDVLAGDIFQRSPALGRLLTFLVERTLAGEAATLKESVIGHELYERPASYDPKLDSVVRVSANRLRVRLEDHYRANPNQRLQIVLPKGSYVPFLEIKEPAEDAVAILEPTVVSEHKPDSTQRDMAPQRIGWNLHSHVFPILSALTILVLICALVWVRHHHASTADTVANDGRAWKLRPFARLGGSQAFAAFSPDGTQIAFDSTTTHDETKTIYIQAAASEEVHRIAPGLRPAWSSDGKRLAFLRPESNGKEQIVLYTLDSGEEVVLAELDGVGSWLCQIPRVAWSRDGTAIYTSSSSGRASGCGLVEINIATGNIHPITPVGGPFNDLEPAVSPDGTTLAFLRGFEMGKSDIFTVSTNGGEAHRLTFDSTDLLGHNWTPDGKALIVASSRDGGARHLWRFQLDGGAPRSLTEGLSEPSFPSPAPNGTEIAFTQYRTAAPLWRAAEGRLTELLDNQSNNTKPSMSPDGRHLLYGSDRSGRSEVWISNADGSDSRALLPVGSVSASAPQWSPDGKRIILQCTIHENSRVCLVDADGTHLVELTGEPRVRYHPSWSRDARTVYFTSPERGKENIFRMDLPTQTVTQMTYEGANKAVESWDGKWLFVAADRPSGGLVVLPVPGTPGEWAEAEKHPIASILGPSPGTDWDVGKEGLVYIDYTHPQLPSLRLYSIDRHASRPLMKLGKQPAGATFSIGVLPDGKSVIFTVVHSSSELTIMSSQK